MAKKNKETKDLSIKYRPAKWEDVKGQDRAVYTLRKQITTKKGLSNAYIFSGKSGVGKTTLARLFFMSLNCEQPKDGNPCFTCPACKNINYCLNEVDGATNRGIDNVRELQKNMYYKSMAGSYTGILIDECHMLSRPAWNALLKSIEEPPEHHFWFFCTTELYKVPKTIQTRSQLFRLQSMSWTTVHHRIKEIADKEKINIKDEHIWEIARASDNNLRQAIHSLEQYSNSKEPEKREIKYDLLQALNDQDYKAIWQIFLNWENNHESIEVFLNYIKYDLFNYLKFRMGLKTNVNMYRLKKYKTFNIPIKKIENFIRIILDIEAKVKGIYDYQSLFLKGILDLKEGGRV
jgi:DNA polymerase III subunit gamma/tau